MEYPTTDRRVNAPGGSPDHRRAPRPTSALQRLMTARPMVSSPDLQRLLRQPYIPRGAYRESVSPLALSAPRLSAAQGAFAGLRPRLPPGAVRAALDAIMGADGIYRITTGQEEAWNIANFSLVQTCTGIGGIDWWDAAGQVSGCLTLQAGGRPLSQPITGSVLPLAIHLAHRREISPGVFRWASRQIWHRDQAGPATLSHQSRVPAAYGGQRNAVPDWIDALDPPLRTPKQPAPAPWVLRPELAKWNVWRTEGTYRGNDAERDVTGIRRHYDLTEDGINDFGDYIAPNEHIGRLNDGRRDGPPYEVDSWDQEWVVSPGMGRVVRPRPGRHQLRRPTFRERERKASASRDPRWWHMFIDTVTEASDIVDLLYWSLGDTCRKKCGPYLHRHEKAQCVSDHWDCLDMQKFIFGAGLMWATDAIVGAHGQAQQSAAREFFSDITGMRGVGLNRLTATDMEMHPRSGALSHLLDF